MCIFCLLPPRQLVARPPHPCRLYVISYTMLEEKLYYVYAVADTRQPSVRMPVDYMHGVLLGIVKMLFSKWFDVKYKKDRFYIGDKICKT